MPLVPAEITKRKFSIVRGRGYDRNEVDEFLVEVANDYSAALQKIAAAGGNRFQSFEDLGREVATVLQTAKESADEVRRKAQEEAEEVRRSAAERATTLVTEAKEKVASDEERASAEVQRMIQEAEREAQDIGETARRRCDELLGDAERRHEQLRGHERLLRSRVDVIQQLVTALRAEVEISGSPEGPSQSVVTGQTGEGEAGAVAAVIDLRGDESSRAVGMETSSAGGNGEPRRDEPSLESADEVRSDQ